MMQSMALTERLQSNCTALLEGHEVTGPHSGVDAGNCVVS